MPVELASTGTDADTVTVPPDGCGRYAVTRAVFLRGLGVVYLAAFLSYW